MSTTRPWCSSIGLLILRLGMAGFMLTHGWGKVQMIMDGRAEQFGDPIGIGVMPSVILITFAEFGCSILIIVGLLTRLAAVPLVIGMAVAAFVGHANDPWTMGQAAELFFAGKTEYPASREPALLYLIAFATLIFTGPGCLSIDALIFRGKRSAEAASQPAA